ncbi:MAG: helicase HerA-like domain-containing protein, partial [Chloroflexota bacterium]
ALLEKIEQVVRLIRSKGVGIFFISQNPLDIPDLVLGQLGNRVQHALRAFTPRDQKAVKAAAQTFRVNPELDTEKAILELGVGEALVSFLEEKGVPGIVQRAFVCPPHSQIGPITSEQRKQIIKQSLVAGHYERVVDRESAFEMLKARAQQAAQEAEPVEEKPKAARKPARQSDDVMTAVMKSAGRAMASQAGRELTRGILGSLLGVSTTTRRRR